MKFYKELFLALYININVIMNNSNSIRLPERYPKKERKEKNKYN